MNQSLAAAAEDRRNNFDFLRFLFASLVLAYHCFALLLGSGPRPEVPGEALATLAGGSGVDFFFVISGFLVSASWARRPQISPFLLKRAFRIYPAFLFASCFCAFVAGPWGADSVPRYWRDFGFVRFFLYLPLLPADVVGPDMARVFARLPYPHVIDGSFWTLRYEFGMYFLVAALGLFGAFRRRVWLLGLFGLLYALFAVLQGTSTIHILSRPLPLVGSPAAWVRFAVFFGSGMIFYLFRDRVSFSLALGLICFGVLLLAGTRLALFSAALPICGSYLLFYAAFHPQIRLQNFARFGDFSYGMYLFAFPVQQLLVQHYGLVLTPFRLFLAAFPLTLLCAVVSWHCVEAPCLALKKGMRSTGSARHGA